MTQSPHSSRNRRLLISNKVGLWQISEPRVARLHATARPFLLGPHRNLEPLLVDFYPALCCKLTRQFQWKPESVVEFEGVLAGDRARLLRNCPLELFGSLLQSAHEFGRFMINSGAYQFLLLGQFRIRRAHDRYHHVDETTDLRSHTQ